MFREPNTGNTSRTNITMLLINLLMETRHPFEMFKNRVKKPLRSFLMSIIERYRRKTKDGVNSAREVLFKGGVIALFTSVIVWLSIFMYVVFYFTYMPNVMHTRPVHLQFKSCDDLKGICSYPSAHVRLTRRQQLLMVGQEYRMRLVMDMPYSESNRNLGMFMCCVELRARGGDLTDSSCRSGLLPYRSPLHTMLATLVEFPLVWSGFWDERKSVVLELFSHYKDDQSQPVTDIYVEIQSRFIELYSATLYIDAHFSGLRYIMFHWPALSAAVGVSTNLMFIALVCALSWYHLRADDEDTQDSEPPKPFGGGTENYLYDVSELQDSMSVKLEPEESNSSDTSFMEDSLAADDILRQATVKTESSYELIPGN